MLAQKSVSILDRCALLVVDELQMLSSTDRGPKLEISIQKVLNANKDRTSSNHTYTRIMCLTTCDCQISYVRKWLTVDGKEPTVIESQSRPVGLEEYVITLDGTFKGKYIRGERDVGVQKETDELEERHLSVEGYNDRDTLRMQKDRLLFTLLKQIYQENPNAKVLVFVADRRTTQSIAKKIAESSILEHHENSNRLLRELKKYERDEAYTRMQMLMQSRIAFHDSSLSTTMREFIEKHFSGIDVDQEDRLKLVVATETLTIGMNMPVDVMIIYDHKIPRGGNQRLPLSTQAYKNYVGRAGRLGQTNQIGRSYLFAENLPEARELLERYINCKNEEIISGLCGIDEEGQAPFYLSLIPDSIQEPGSAARPVELKDLKNIQKKSFSHACSDTKDRISVDHMMYFLYKADMCNVVPMMMGNQSPDSIPSSVDNRDKAEGGNGEQLFFGEYLIYHLLDNAIVLAPFALSIDTSRRIDRVFRSQGKYQTAPNSVSGITTTKILEGGGFPNTISAHDISTNKYLLDILYAICQMPEMKALTQFRFTSDTTGIESIRQNIEDALSVIYKEIEESDGKLAFWKNSYIYRLFNDDTISVPENSQYVALERTMLLWYWTRGMDVGEIKKKLRMSVLYSGDLGRMAEMAGYLIEAASKVVALGQRRRFGQGGSYDHESISSALYALSTEVYYGMPRKLVIIANQHLYGLDRRIVLEIGRQSEKKGYDSPIQFVRQATAEDLDGIMSETMRHELVASIENINFMDDFSALLKRLTSFQNEFVITNDNANVLMGMAQEGANSIVELEQFFWQTDNYNSDDSLAESQRFFYGNKVLITKLSDQFASLNINENTIRIGVLSARSSMQIRNEFKSGGLNLCITDEDEIDVKHMPNTGRYRIHYKGTEVNDVDILMSMKTFAYLLAQIISYNSRDGVMLYELLRDMRNVRYIPNGLNQVKQLLRNYILQRGISGTGGMQVQILCDFRNREYCEMLLQKLCEQNVPHDILQWGSGLQQLAQADVTAPVVLVLNRRSREESKSVEMYVKHLQRFKNARVLAVFEHQKDKEEWDDDPHFPDMNLCSIVESNAMDAVACIKRFLDAYNQNPNEKISPIVGISYAHDHSLLDSIKERPAVIALKKLVDHLNSAFGQEYIFFDANSYWKQYFDGNGAVDITLDLYRQCQYWIVLNDEFYTTGPNCPCEYEAINQIAADTEMYNRVRILRVNNGQEGSLRNPDRDYGEELPFDDEGIRALADQMIPIIRQYIERHQET